MARKASTEILPESSEASGVGGDDEEDSGSNDSTSPTGLCDLKCIISPSSLHAELSLHLSISCHFKVKTS